MTRTGFVIFSLVLLLGLPLICAAGAMAVAAGLTPANCPRGGGDMGCFLLVTVGSAAAPVLIVMAGIGMGIVVLLRARTTSLSGFWSLVVMVVTVQMLALVASLAVQGGFAAQTLIGAGTLDTALGSTSPWLLGAFLVFLLLVPEWRGPAPLDIGLSLIAALAAIIVIAVGHSMNVVPGGYLLDIQEAIANALANVPNVDWIALGVFVTALTGIWVGRMLPEAE